MNRRWWVIGLTLALGLSTAEVMTGGAKEPSVVDDNEDVYKKLELFEQALSMIRDDYVEEPTAQQLVYGALKGMLGTLDPYSQFLDPDSYNELKVDTEGQFGGLGIEITVKDNWLVIISPIHDTPAYHAGLLPGDRIVKIDGELTRGITINDAVKKLRGKPNTKVTLTLLREGDAALKDVELERAIIKIDSVSEAKLLEDHIGYIRLSDFREKTSKELEEAIMKLKGQEMDSLVLDLRNNPGGLLDVAIEVAEFFLDRHQLIVTTKGRVPSQNQEMRSSANGLLGGVPLVVLINEGSASASEILAGAIQDHRRGVIMGTTSHGKASVQTILPLKDGSALRLTTSKYFTPSGRLIEGKGIVPDVAVPLERPKEETPEPEGKPKDRSAEAVFKQIEAGKPVEDAEAPPKPLDNQMARAVDLLKGIKVYQSKSKS